MEEGRMQESCSGGSIEVICGSMFSGKSEELIRRVRRVQIARKKVQIFKPLIDIRYQPTYVYSHDGSKIEATCIKNAVEILDEIEQDIEVIAIDETQFFDQKIVEVCQLFWNFLLQ